MKLTFVSNYINHHQIPMAEELYASLGDEYRFIETEPMEEERIRMGWDSHTQDLPYVLQYAQSEELCRELIENSDVVVFGGTDDESYIAKRLQEGKPVIRVSERLYKEGQWKAISPRGLRKKYLDHTRYRNAPVYLLCAGAYVPSDFHIVHAYPDKMFRWGYFPPFEPQDVDDLLARKRTNSVPKILWSGRFLDWKHPDDALKVAAALKAEGLAFEMILVGGGEMEETLRTQIEKEDLADVVSLPGFLTPQEVRAQMEQADIYLFTSDYKEGWGAVLNEAMNSGCGVIANVAAGASAYLVEHGKNGLLYRNGDFKQLLSHVRYLLKQADVREKMGKNAYHTIAQTWNASRAAEMVLALCKRIMGEENATLPPKGPGSKAPVISQRNMYHAVVER